MGRTNAVQPDMRRLPPLALLFLLLLTACAAGSDAGDQTTGSGVRGRVLLGPTCPVEIEGSPCPDEPAAGVEVRAIRDGEAVAEATSDADGRFELLLDPGTYTLEAVIGPDGPGMFAKPVQVTVSSGGFVDVVVPVDSGIR